jgi:hypothetical protein
MNTENESKAKILTSFVGSKKDFTAHKKFCWQNGGDI